MQISKSDYMLFLKHPAWLWLKKNDKYKLPPIDEDTQAIFDGGHLFESYAVQLFPDSVQVEWDMSNYQGYKNLLPLTKKAIASGAKTILQARFGSGDITCISDVIVRVDNQTFDLYEIKSSTSVKPEHEYDLAFQVECIEQSGYQIRNIYVVHVNNEYVRRGDIELEKITKTVDVTEKVKNLKEFTLENIKAAQDNINLRKCPDLTPAHTKLNYLTEWLAIYRTLVPVEDYSIYDLCSIDAEQIDALETFNIKSILQIPDSFELKERQIRQVQATKTNTIAIDHQAIKEFTSNLKYPLYFLDYETLTGVIPYFDGLSPYKQLPFQYSLHVQEKPGGEVKHFSYLHSDSSNPVQPLSDALKSQIGTKGTVLVWYEGFEKTCNNLMGSMDPQYFELFEQLNARISDLMTPFSTGAYVDKAFYGSASIKKVLPVLIPELSYKELDIHGGQAAQRLWMEAILDGKRVGDREKILADLLKYCELDTLAMVKILEFLLNL